ncbi:hypothetical protein J437_LFUL007422 [Ladona fulva]|uniref:Small ribosomal subunit protein bS16m n=1 Tax=Ladona fulva TaxID=123851 RepID=A0A8K0K4D5_LADFU|nr:hypothetical protein J437_LFUL007422 [Ladona fulva]
MSFRKSRTLPSMAIRFVRLGCTNRPFYHIVVMNIRANQHEEPIEQVGSYDPLPNVNNEKLVALNFDRIRYWMANGARFSKPLEELLGLAGFLPLHPRTVLNAWRNRLNKPDEEGKNENKE